MTDADRRIAQKHDLLNITAIEMNANPQWNDQVLAAIAEARAEGIAEGIAEEMKKS